MKAIRYVFLLCILCINILIGYAQSSAEKDVLLKIFQEQVDSLYDVYKKASVPAYYLSFRIDKSDAFLFSAEMGSLTKEKSSLQAVLTIQIRVGNPLMDNFYFDDNHKESSHNREHIIRLPLDENTALMTEILQRETAIAYKKACQDYQKVLSVMSDNQTVREIQGEYVQPLPYAYNEPFLTIPFKEKEFKQRVVNCSEVLAQEVSFTNLVTASYITERKYFVSSDGAAIVQNKVHSFLQIELKGQNDDGVRFSLPKRYDTEYPDELPTVEEIVRDAETMVIKMQQMQKSKPVKADICPVVFANEAAGVFWQQSIVPFVADYQGDLNVRVFTSDISVESNAGLSLYGKDRLLGAYRYDDEGVEGQKVQLIEKGILLSGCYSSVSNKIHALSNGCGRAVAGEQPVSVPANILVSTSHPYSDEDLREYLKREAVASGKEFGYWVASAQVDKVSREIQSLMAWKVYVDGRPDEMVYGIVFSGTPRILLSQVKMAGNTTCCVACDYKGVPYHCCSPAVLLGMVESKESQNICQNKSLISFQPGREEEISDENFSEVIFQAMEDEMSNDRMGYTEGEVTGPYYIGYLVTDARKCHVESSCGSLIQSDIQPVRDLETYVLVGDNNYNSDFVEFQKTIETEENDFPLDNNYDNIRYHLHHSTDLALKEAFRAYSEKLRRGAPNEIPDRSSIWVTNMQMDNPYSEIDLETFQNVANELSSRFEEFGFLTNSGVVLDAFRGDAYFKATDGVQYCQPVSLVRFHIFAQTTAEDGQELRDCSDFFYRDIREINDKEDLYRAISKMCFDLKSLQNTETVCSIENGPVIFSGDAAACVFARAFVEKGAILARRHNMKIAHDGTLIALQTEPALAKELDRMIVSRTVDVTAVDALTAYNGLSLIGNFYIDADGMKVENDWDIISRGKLITLLSNRVPIEQNHQSNGHQRLALRKGKLVTELGAGVLKLSCYNQLREDQLVKKMCKKARAMGNQYAYVITKTMWSNGRIQPVYAYRVNAVSGKRTLVRLNVALDVDMQDFQYLMAASNQIMAANRMVRGNVFSSDGDNKELEGVSCSFILPDMLLFDKLNFLIDK